MGEFEATAEEYNEVGRELENTLLTGSYISTQESYMILNIPYLMILMQSECHCTCIDPSFLHLHQKTIAEAFWNAESSETGVGWNVNSVMCTQGKV